MKRNLLFLTGAAVALAASAQSAPEFIWANLIDGPTTAGDQSTDVCIAGDNNVYWLGTYGSHSTQGLEITYAGQPLFSGAPYEGTSNNGNLTLLKTNAAGEKQWVVYTTSGDWASNAGGVAATADGGCVVAAKMRHTAGMETEPIVIVDASGNETKIEWSAADGVNCYRLMVARITPGGNVSWTRSIDFATDGVGEKPVTDAFSIGGVTLDDNDNIYLALGYSNVMNVGKADGTTETFAPNGLAGATATVPSDFMLLALDSDGYYSTALTLEGTAAETKCTGVEWAAGALYVQGYIKGDGSDLKLAGNTLTPGDVPSPLIFRASSSLDVDWVKCMKADTVAGKSALQPGKLTVCGDNLWYCGLFNEKITDSSNPENYLTATQGAVREGFIIKLNANDGSWMGARSSRNDDFDNPSAVAKTGLTGYLKVMQNSANDSKIYVYGYVMNATVGVFLREYDALTLEANLADGQNNVITGGGVPSAQNAAYDDATGAVFMTARGNKAFNVGDTELTPAAWGILLSRFDLPDDMKNSIENIAAAETDGADAPVEYFNLQGIKVSKPAAGQIYIRRQGKTVSKVVF